MSHPLVPLVRNDILLTEMRPNADMPEVFLRRMTSRSKVCLIIRTVEKILPFRYLLKSTSAVV